MKLMLCTRYSGGISQLQLKPGRIHLLPKILSFAGKQGQKSVNNLRSRQAKLLPLVWHPTETWWWCSWHTSPVCAPQNNNEKEEDAKSSQTVTQNTKRAYRSLMQKSRNSPGQCLGTTKGLRTTGDYVASHKVSRQRSGLFPAAGRSEQPVSPWQRFGDVIKTRAGQGRVRWLIAGGSRTRPVAAAPGRSSSWCCHWFSSPRSAAEEGQKEWGREMS